MKNIIILILLIPILMAGCTYNESSSEKSDYLKKNIEKLNELFKKFENPSQTFRIEASNPSIVTGKQGTIISINPNDLETENGQPLGKNIEVELMELTNQNQLLNSNAQTVSNGKLLVSGGAYYINITSDGNQLKLKEGRSLKVEFPKISNDEMTLFYGQRDSLGQLNWQQANDTFKTKLSATPPPALGFAIGSIKSDTSIALTKEEKEYQKKSNEVYSAINLSSFGWINCDHFLDVQNKTDLHVNFTSTNKNDFTNIYLVFNDINSIIQSYYYVDIDGKIRNIGFTNIPIGYKVRLVAFTIKDGKVFSYNKNLIIKENQTMTLALKETSDKELKELLGK